MYVIDHVDRTYYVEGVTDEGNLTGVQMIKAPLHEVPGAYKNDVVQEKALIGSPDGTTAPKSYVQAVTRDHASYNKMPSKMDSVKSQIAEGQVRKGYREIQNAGNCSIECNNLVNSIDERAKIG